MSWVNWLELYFGIGFLMAVVLCGTAVWLGLLEPEDISGKLYHGSHVVMLWPLYLLVFTFHIVTDAFTETLLEGGRRAKEGRGSSKRP